MAVQVQNNFVKFFGGRKPESYIYEDEQCVVFEEDLESKQAPVHFLVVPKRLIKRLVDDSFDDKQLLDHILQTAQRIAVQRGLSSLGYHVMVDEDHRNRNLKTLHIFGRALHHMVWPMGPGTRL